LNFASGTITLARPTGWQIQANNELATLADTQLIITPDYANDVVTFATPLGEQQVELTTHDNNVWTTGSHVVLSGDTLNTLLNNLDTYLANLTSSAGADRGAVVNAFTSTSGYVVSSATVINSGSGYADGDVIFLVDVDNEVQDAWFIYDNGTLTITSTGFFTSDVSGTYATSTSG